MLAFHELTGAQTVAEASCKLHFETFTEKRVTQHMLNLRFFKTLQEPSIGTGCALLAVYVFAIHTLYAHTVWNLGAYLSGKTQAWHQRLSSGHRAARLRPPIGSEVVGIFRP